MDLQKFTNFTFDLTISEDIVYKNKQKCVQFVPKLVSDQQLRLKHQKLHDSLLRFDLFLRYGSLALSADVTFENAVQTCNIFSKKIP